MFGFAWLALRQAQDAIKDGRLEEALRLLSDPSAQTQRGSGALLVQLARAFVERGERQLRRDDAEAAWRDLLQAEQLQTAERSTDRLREALARLGLAEVRGMLQAGETGRADEAVARLRLRGVRSAELAVLDEVVRGWQAARELAGRGEFPRAVETVERVRRLLPGPAAALDRFAAELDEKQRSFGPLLARLHEALDLGRWREVIERAEQVLAAAPNHAEARRARGRAWQVVEPVPTAVGVSPEARTVEPVLASPRFLLWIDGVGGYLICLGNRLTFGQAAQPGVDLPLVADVSRIHATLTRDAEGYLLETVRPVQVNNHSVTRALLRSNDRITLGATCQLCFRQPVPVSASAVLEIVSGHRLVRSVEGVLLMAETLIIGPGAQAHVTIPDLKDAVILFRHKDGIGLRSTRPLTVNGQRVTDRCVLGAQAQVAGEEISFALEPVGTRL
jgi:tetratricopeptide (TPR) repeat protein